MLVGGGDDDGAGRSGGGGGGVDLATVLRTARALKQLAGELRVPLLVLTHSARGQNKVTTRPTQGDIKWGGEGDADNVVFVHRPIQSMDSRPPARAVREGDENQERLNRWHQERDDLRDLAELVVAKRRQGPTGVHRMKFNGPTTSFSEWGVPDYVP